jgi:hypothetical protein
MPVQREIGMMGAPSGLKDPALICLARHASRANKNLRNRQPPIHWAVGRP